jgi:hypothetical protein
MRRSRPAWTLAALLLLGCGHGPERMRGFPDRVLWAWNAPQDLRFLTRGEAVAFLGGELMLADRRAVFSPRRAPLLVSPGTPLMAVLRVDARQPALDAGQRRAMVESALGLLDLPGVRALQIDFDALASQRVFYAQVLAELRTRMPAQVPLSMTALGSWCSGDAWIAGLPVDEQVPMLFRMGSDGPNLVRLLRRGVDWQAPGARHAYGIATDEALPPLRGSRRIYVFQPGPWTAQAWARVSQALP